MPLTARQAFAERLELWRVTCGRPTYRILPDLLLEAGHEYARGTISDRLTSGRGLDLTFIETFVTACHRYAKLPGEPNLEPFRRGFHRMLRDEARERSPQQWIGDVPSLAGAYQTRRVGAALDEGMTPGRGYVLTGPGGTGKTQLTADLARRSWADYQVSLVVWVSASSREKVVAAYAKAARAIGITEPDDLEAAKRFLASLASRQGLRWLVVLDDLQDPEDLHGLWPPAGNGNIVVTTRCREAALAGGDRIVVPVGLFEPEESHRYLREKLGPLGFDGADRLAEQLGHLPLALSQAAAFIHNRNLTCDEYLRRFGVQLLKDLHPRGLPDDYPAHLADALARSVGIADDQSPVGVARPLLEVAAVLGPDSIPVGVFTSKAAQTMLGDRRGRTTTADDAWDGLSNLHLLSLCEFDENRRTVRVHRLLQRAVRETMHPELTDRVVACAADAILEIWLQAEYNTPLIDLLRSGADALAGQGALGSDGRLHPVVLRAGNSLPIQGLPEKALVYWGRLLPMVTAALGEEHPDTLIVRNNMYWAQGRAGDPGGALAGFLDLLEARRRVLGSADPNTLATRHAIAMWRHETGDVAGAINLVQGLVPEYRRVLGANHRDTLNTRLLLISMLGESTPPAVTAADLRLLLDDYRQALGPERPETLEAELRLTGVLVTAGEMDEARARITTLIDGYVQVAGPDDVETLQVRYYAADLHDSADAMRELRGDVQLLMERGHSEVGELQEWIEQWLADPTSQAASA